MACLGSLFDVMSTVPLQSELLKKSTRYQPVLLLIKLRLAASVLLVQIVDCFSVSYMAWLGSLFDVMSTVPLQSELLKKSTRYQPVLLLIKLRLAASLLLVQIVDWF